MQALRILDFVKIKVSLMGLARRVGSFVVTPDHGTAIRFICT